MLHRKLNFFLKSLLCFRFIVKDRESFFTAAQRSQIVWEILMRANYDTTQKVIPIILLLLL